MRGDLCHGFLKNILADQLIQFAEINFRKLFFEFGVRLPRKFFQFGRDKVLSVFSECFNHHGCDS